MEMQVDFDRTGNRFVTLTGGMESSLLFSKGHKGEMVLSYTFVPPSLRGRGIAGELVHAAAMHARKEGLKIIPACSYTRVYFERHPEFRDILAGNG